MSQWDTEYELEDVELTGEFRSPLPGELYLGQGASKGCVMRGHGGHSRGEQRYIARLRRDAVSRLRNFVREGNVSAYIMLDRSEVREILNRLKREAP